MLRSLKPVAGHHLCALTSQRSHFLTPADTGAICPRAPLSPGQRAPCESANELIQMPRSLPRATAGGKVILPVWGGADSEELNAVLVPSRLRLPPDRREALKPLHSF